MINNNLSDYLAKDKYGKVLQAALYEQNYVVFLSSKREGGFDPRNPPGCATDQKFAKLGWVEWSLNPRLKFICLTYFGILCFNATIKHYVSAQSAHN